MNYAHDFLKVTAVSPRVHVGNPPKNLKEILAVLESSKAAFTVFPELALTGYTANDLFFQGSLLKEVNEALETLLKTNPYSGIILLGAPFDYQGLMYNVVYVIQGSKVLGIVPKLYLPNTQEFYEKRWFTSGLHIIDTVSSVRIFNQTIPFGSLLFETDDQSLTFGIEICEDMWAPLSPGNLLSLQGAKIIFNLSASNETFGKRPIRLNAILEHSRRNMGAYVYVSAGASESTSETVFSGHQVFAQAGSLVLESENFSQETQTLTSDLDISSIRYQRQHFSSYRDLKVTSLYPMVKASFTLKKTEDISLERPFDQTPFVPKTEQLSAFNTISALQEAALLKRILHTKAKTLIIGVSGGLDSTLALCVAVKVAKKAQLPSTAVIGVTMPAKATSERTFSQAQALMESLNVTIKTISIEEAVNDHYTLIDHDGKTEDAAFENAQARTRTMILMNLANMHQGLVIGTGDMSELALGFATYNGDQMSMYGINQGIPKTLVRFMVEYYGRYGFENDLSSIMQSIIETPISPELTENQVTESLIGSYEINDFILVRYLRHGDPESRIAWLIEKTFHLSPDESMTYVKRFFKRFFSQQFKRQASPDAPKICDIALGPRSDLRLPSDISYGDQDV
jgi:NAD+ synthase (glutamine-hydrolysing)